MSLAECLEVTLSMPKTIRNKWKEALTYDNLYAAYKLAKKGKTHRTDVILFSLRYEDYLLDILDKLKNGSYSFSKYKIFYVYEPKKRKILAASFRDRIVHTWYVKQFIIPYLVPTFISTSYACIESKGMHMAARDVQKAMRVVDGKYINPYVLKMDIAKYFENISRKKVYEIISGKIKDRDILDLSKKILDSSNDYDTEGKEGLGLPIGNYTSQMFANIYLHEADAYAKHVLKCKWYYRYMDDTVILLENKERAKYVLSMISEFLFSELGLKLNSKTNIFKLSQGVNFCGYKISTKHMHIRDKGKRKLKLKLRYIDKGLRNNEISISDAKRKLAGHIRIYTNGRYRRINI